jgi:transposase-like protein
MPIRSNKDRWSDNKKAAAKSMAEGTESQAQIAERLGIQESTISRWKSEPEFLMKVDELTLALERHSLAGMLRRLDQKQEETAIGKNEWLKIEEFKAKLQGFDRTRVEHSGTIVQIIDNIPNTDENIKPAKKSGETD